MYTSVIVYKPITGFAKVFGCLLFLFQWHSYDGIAGMNHVHIGTSHILQLGSHHWHKSETVEDLKLNIAEHHMKYLQILKPDFYSKVKLC